MADPSAPPTHRLLSVDALRGLAALLMVQQHVGIWMVDRREYAEQVASGFAYLNMTGGIAAPLFVCLAGVGVALGRGGAQADASPSRRRRWACGVRLRGGVLLVFGLLLNLLVPSWFSWGSFYVLHLLGCWLLLAPWLSERSSVVLVCLAVAILAVAVVGHTWLQTPIVLTNGRMADVQQPGGALRLALFEGQFPLFPWLALGVGGLLVGRALAAKQTGRLLWAAAACGVGAGLARLPVLLVQDAGWALPWRAVCRARFYPLTTFFALGLFAVCVVLLALFVWLERRGVFHDSSWLVLLGRTSLSLLFVHIVLFREVFEAFDLRHRMSPLQALGVIVAFCALWALLARPWRRIRYRYGLEWWLRRVG